MRIRGWAWALVVATSCFAIAACTGDSPDLPGGTFDDERDGGGRQREDGGGPSQTPGELTIGDVPIIHVAPGATAEVPITIERHGNAGEVRVGLEPLPPSLSAPPITLAPGASTGTLVVTASAEARQQRGKVQLVAGIGERRVTREVALVVRGRPGDRDATFGTGGALTAQTAGEGFALARTADESLLVLGKRAVGCTVTRINPEGVLDTTFGTGGRVDVDEAGGVCARFGVHKSGAFVLALTESYGTTSSKVVLHAFTPTGAPRTSFGTNGRLVLAEPTGAAKSAGVVVKDDGEIVAAVTSAGKTALVRVNPVTSAVALGAQNLQPDEATGILLDGAGLAVIYGRKVSPPVSWGFVRFAKGGPQGAERAAENYTPAAAAADGTGRLVIVGTNYPTSPANAPTTGIVARFLPTAVDPDFGTKGFAEDANVGAHVAVAIADGKPYVLGRAGTLVAPQTTLARYLDNGTRDVTFAPSGVMVDPDTAAPVDIVALDGSPLLVVQRRENIGGSPGSVLVRYWR